MKNKYALMIKRPLMAVAILLLCPMWLLAQQKTLTGKVVDNSKIGMPGVNVSLKGTAIGTITDLDGKFSIQGEVSPTSVLVFSFIGFATQEIFVGSQTSFNVTMEEAATSLDEFVVVGYGTATKKELTGATAKVSGENITKINIPRMDQALQGQVAGVSINTNSGSPGGSSSIRIRGLSTFGDNDPLILVDGIVYDSEGLNALNPSDIESINVLKDATAGIYGVRAANGVIIIETKKGTINAKPKLEIDYYYGTQQTSRRLNLLNATEYAVIKNEMLATGGLDAPFNNTSLGEGTDWQDEVFTTAPIQNLNVNLSGGTKSSRYSVGVSNFSQEGIVGGEKARFARQNVRLNFGTDLNDKLTLNSVFLYTHEQRSTLPENGIGSVLYNTINAFPTVPVRRPNGDFSYMEEVSDIINPIQQMENTFNESRVNKIVGKEELRYKINDNFELINQASFNYALVDDKAFFPLAWYGAGKAQNTAINEDLDPTLVEIADSVFVERGASVYEQRANYTDLTYEGYLNYNRSFAGIHNVKGTAGVSVFNRSGNALNGIAYNIPNNSVDFADISANQAAGGFLNNTGSFEFEERLLSSFLRAEYNYDYKYLFSAIVRRDGSSRFGPNNRFGWFPSFSGAWVISEEDFYNISAISFAKLRASYGISGNDQIANFAYRALLNGEGVYVLGDVITNGVAIGRAANPDLKWESTRQLNLGLDLKIFDLLDFTTNYYIKNTFDLLFQPDVSAVLGSYGAGGFPPFINAGNVRNQGWEFELAYFSPQDQALTYQANFNLTTLRNEVIETPDGIDFLPGAAFGVGGNIATRFEAGFPIGYFVGFETDGVFQTQEEIDNAAVKQDGAKPGDLRFVDQNGDGVISFNDNTDRVQIGSPIPDLTLGLSGSAAYKGFDFSANFYAALGQEIIRNYERNQPFANQLDYVINRWTGEGSTDEHPRQTVEANRNNEFSDYFVEDGSFVRLRNVQLGYTLPTKWTEKAKLSKVRVYVAANNLFTLTRYQGFDPDIGSVGGALAAGVDYGFYPQPRTFMGGVNLKF